jgi:hypothetical protein
MRLVLNFLLCLFAVCPAVAATREDVLFDVTFDMDHAGTSDRAALVLVGPGRTDFSEQTKDVYLLGEGERADLFIYLNHGDGPLDLTRPPTLRKNSLISRDELSFVIPLVVSQKGSLNVVSSNGFGNTFNTTQTLTIVYRDGKFRVAGWAQDSYNSREAQSSHCSVNYLAGKAVKRGTDGKDVRLKGVFKPIELEEWTTASEPAVCEE